MHYFDCDKIQFEGTSSKNPLAFKHYNPGELVDGKSMKDHLRFAAPYWHVMRNELADPFGGGTAQMPWDDGSNSVDNALARVDVFFEFLDKIGIDLLLLARSRHRTGTERPGCFECCARRSGC